MVRRKHHSANAGSVSFLFGPRSGLRVELSDIFCDLNGATRHPLCEDAAVKND
jgi:hypothetical protein